MEKAFFGIICFIQEEKQHTLDLLFLPGGCNLKYLGQFCIIALFSFIGEVLHALIPFPVPAAIYGLVLLTVALLLKWIRPDQIRETSDFLVQLLPLLFVAPLVGIVNSAPLILENLVPIIIAVVAGTAVTFAVSGGIVQLLLHRKGGQA